MSLFCDRNCDGIITSQIQIRQWPQYVWFSRFDFTQRFETRGHCIALEIGGEVISFVLCHLDGKRSSGIFGVVVGFTSGVFGALGEYLIGLESGTLHFTCILEVFGVYLKGLKWAPLWRDIAFVLCILSFGNDLLCPLGGSRSPGKLTTILILRFDSKQRRQNVFFSRETFLALLELDQLQRNTSAHIFGLKI